MRLRNLIRSVALLASVAVALAAGANAALEPPPATTNASLTATRIEFEKYTLANGLQVILHVDRRSPRVHVSQWFHVGSRDEPVGRTGFAHLFEHVMFEGSQHAPQRYAVYGSKAGIYSGGRTDKDRTKYFSTAPSTSLEYLLWLEADRLATLPEALTQAKLDSARGVVQNERRQSENQPYGSVFEVMLENLYPEGHPYAWPTIGSHEDLRAATLDDVRDFFRTWYTPNNLSLVLAGDFDPVQAKRLIERYFGSIAPGPPLRRLARWVPDLRGDRILEVTDRVPYARLYFGWPSPPRFERGDVELEIAAAILADGPTSRLNRTLVERGQLASDVSASHDGGEIAGEFGISVTARPGTSLQQLEKIVMQEIARLAKEAPTAAELEPIRKKKIELGSTGTAADIVSKADRLNFYNSYLGDPDRFESELARYRGVTAEGIREAVNRWLHTGNRVLLRVFPEISGLPTTVAVDRSQVPPLGTEAALVVPQVETARLANGLQIFLVRRADSPHVVGTLATRAGTVADPPGHEGLAHLTVSTMTAGKLDRSTKAGTGASDPRGGPAIAFIRGSAAPESAQLSFEVMKADLPAALGVVAGMSRRPDFSAERFAREKRLLLDTLARDASDPNALAERIRPMVLFGREHPYGRPRSGLPGTIESLTREDLLRFHETNWKPDGAALILAGDLSLEEAEQLAREHFGAWSGSPPAVPIPDAQPLGPGRVFVVDRPGAAQTVISELLPGPLRSAADYPAAELANAVWGAGLGRNVRAEKGYTYTVSALTSLHTRAAAWMALAGVQTDKTSESIIEFNAELARVGGGGEPLTEAELAELKTSQARNLEQANRVPQLLVGLIAHLWDLDLPVTEMQRFAQAAERVTLAEVQEAGKRYAAPGRAKLLLVGDYAKIAPGLKELGLGDITLLDTEGRPVNHR